MFGVFCLEHFLFDDDAVLVKNGAITNEKKGPTIFILCVLVMI